MTGKVVSICRISQHFPQNSSDSSRFQELFPLQEGMQQKGRIIVHSGNINVLEQI